MGRSALEIIEEWENKEVDIVLIGGQHTLTGMIEHTGGSFLVVRCAEELVLVNLTSVVSIRLKRPGSGFKVEVI